MPPTAVLLPDRAAAERWLTERSAAGLRERELRELPEVPWDLGDRGWVTWMEPVDAAAVATGLAAVLRGVAVAFVVPADRDVAELLCDELRRVVDTTALDEVPVDAGGPANPVAPATTDQREVAAELDPETLELLAVLAGGASTAEAAAAVHVSLRTAERRLTAARRALGVRSTAEAVRLAVGRVD